MDDKLKLTDLAEEAYERATKTGAEKDVSAAVRAIYSAARETVDAKGAHEDPVVLAFLVELGGKIRRIEERVGVLLVPPVRGPLG